MRPAAARPGVAVAPRRAEQELAAVRPRHARAAASALLPAAVSAPLPAAATGDARQPAERREASALPMRLPQARGATAARQRPSEHPPAVRPMGAVRALPG
jgi:hypothetical protein